MLFSNIPHALFVLALSGFLFIPSLWGENPNGIADAYGTLVATLVHIESLVLSAV